MAQDIHALTQKLGYQRIRIVGHDIGLMVAYAFAAQYPSEVDRIVLMDAFLPGVGKWRDVWLMRDLWHFHFYGKTPLALVHGRERIYFEHFWNDFAANPAHSLPERDRRFYAKAYARPGGMRAGFEYFRAFEKDAEEFARFAQKPLPMPMLVLTGEKASGEFLIEQGRLVATNVEGVVIRGSGHWLMEEAPRASHPKTGGISQRRERTPSDRIVLAHVRNWRTFRRAPNATSIRGRCELPAGGQIPRGLARLHPTRPRTGNRRATNASCCSPAATRSFAWSSIQPRRATRTR